ncbi:hypothetical protein FHW23_000792 [Curtobacterium pusillum]|uniref:SnoaL-like domain-containing protein n=1 Tax=Curtobacterium pusillum TaxID=69373 RepID=A0AAW3T4C9_9MICO|nr:nuclear transport factor 2 family protein [Curtobacterium pusillum]MBA8989560.1 hypothetical protein [Curtobacterium pusillum]
MATVSELLTANLRDVFGNRDADSRRAAIERTYSPDVTFTDPEGTAVGRDALDQKAAELLEKVPGAFQFVEKGRRYASETHGALAWGVGPVGAPAVRGIDVIEVRGGVVVTLTTFFAEPDAAV